MSAESNFLAHEGLKKYLKQHEIEVNDENVCQQILNMLEQKDENIKAMEMHITKLKAENSKNNKIITQLQQKISQLCPNLNNTGSSFMMASQFKDYFDDFMKNCLPSCFSPLLSYPQAYAEYSQTVISTVYQGINTKINKKLNQVCKILTIQNSTQNINKVKLCLLKILQDNWKILVKQGQQQTKLSNFITHIKQYQNEQIRQIIGSEEYLQFDSKLIQICSYMLLQQRKWQFVFPKSNKFQKYTKKDFTCIDGWIKEKEDVIIVLEGLMRENQQGVTTKHPNLKNYVIPYTQEEDGQKYVLICKENIKQLSKQNNNIEKNEDKNQAAKIDQYSQYSPKGTTLPLSTKILKLRQQQIHEQNRISKIENQSLMQLKSDASYNSLKINKNKKTKKEDKKQYIDENPIQKIETVIRKLSSGQAKITQNAIQTDSVSLMLSPNILKGVKKSHQNSNHTLRLQNIQNIDNNHTNHTTANPSMSLAKSSKIKNNKNSNINTNHNLISDPSFEQIIPLPNRKRDLIEQMPLKRQSSKTKKSNSRKVSAGKIVGQALQFKQNNLNRNNKQNIFRQKQNKENINKEAMYKDMIKQKMGADHKTERTKQLKHKQKEEDRPLRIMNIKKMREKYLN